MKKINILIIAILFLNPLSLYFFYGSSKITIGITSDYLLSKKEVYLKECNEQKMFCSNNDIECDCEIINTRNCACYKCLNDLNFDDCSQCYMPTSGEAICVKGECKIPNFP